ncbi:YihY/virulence factor BrkB family protein [Streptomyces antarcticus]|uniref:YihY/virulence factor BrkB family protein n=1 Tax=Streptomyces antarcticus TaxID=2996458 RepID=UPI00226E6A01|nr:MULTISPECIES: YihY/virulence factor BrkB family protein [unclassified Streptomyces]MCY0943222.1 YihY/virulence factor BrkB family protein [Streptomyces sp. H34-AA3]MCY0953327.1 YihY/virulence factor BrkB family protein [Streptomyces sp. H27-S2]MCZ4085193.1 YihY/virulence factor BrkB family protein [Streptomyces sp. H34-S5]
MGTARRVPQRHDVEGEELSGDEAWTALRRYGSWSLARDSFVRFRYADGFSHARALALQTVLSIVPLAIAAVGLSGVLHTEDIGRIAELTIRRLTSGPGQAVVDEALSESRRHAGNGGQAALWLGLLFSLSNVTTGLCQVERGANRIYGNERDRPFLSKYARGLTMAALAGFPLGLSFILTVLGSHLTHALAEVYQLSPTTVQAWEILRWPVGVLLAVLATSAIFRLSPRRRQPGYTWLAFGAVVYLLLWNLATWGLSVYVGASSSFTSVYGPLSAIVSLLLWSYLTSMALFLGLAFAAQLEAVRAGVREPVKADPGV